MLLVDPSQGRVLFDDEIKDTFANEKPYRSWIDAETLALGDLAAEKRPAAALPADAGVPLAVRQAAHGYHADDVADVVVPMAQNGAAPLASMGADVPLACLSARPRSFFDYFSQMFAQVTNPPIDALREAFKTSTSLYVGSHGNLLEDARANCRLVRLETPLLDAAQFEPLRASTATGSSRRCWRAPIPRTAARMPWPRRWKPCSKRPRPPCARVPTSWPSPTARGRAARPSRRFWPWPPYTTTCCARGCARTPTSSWRRATP